MLFQSRWSSCLLERQMRDVTWWSEWCVSSSEVRGLFLLRDTHTFGISWPGSELQNTTLTLQQFQNDECRESQICLWPVLWVWPKNTKVVDFNLVSVSSKHQTRPQNPDRISRFSSIIDVSHLSSFLLISLCICVLRCASCLYQTSLRRCVVKYKTCFPVFVHGFVLLFPGLSP